MYISIYIILVSSILCSIASGGYLAKHFTEECIRLCSKAIKCLSDLADRLKEGKVTVQELKMLTTHLTQAVNLYSPKVVGTVANNPSFNITDIVVQRNSEVQKFELHCATIRNLLKYCDSITDGKCLCIYSYALLSYK